MASLKARDMRALFTLLRQYAGASQSMIGAAVDLEQYYVCRIMTGRVEQVRRIELLERIADGLDMPDRCRIALGLAPTRHPWTDAMDQASSHSDTDTTDPTTGEVSEVKRSEFLLTALGTSGAIATAALTGFLRPTPTEIPTRLGQIDVDRITEVAHTINMMGNRGISLAREAIAAQLRYSAELLTADCSSTLRDRMFAAIGKLAGASAFMAFDGGAYDDARKWFRFGLACLDESTAWCQRALLLGDMARQEMYCGDADRALTYIELALVRADRIPRAAVAMLAVLRGRALARLGRASDTLLAFELADNEFQRTTEIPDSMAFYDDAEHHGDVGHGLVDLEIRTGKKAGAARRLAFAVENHAELFARPRTLSRTKLATIEMVNGDPESGAAIAHIALDEAERMHSSRVADYMRDLHRKATPHAAIREVAEVQGRIVDYLRPA